jgi:hypothetical protein
MDEHERNEQEVPLVEEAAGQPTVPDQQADVEPAETETEEDEDEAGSG